MTGPCLCPVGLLMVYCCAVATCCMRWREPLLVQMQSSVSEIATGKGILGQVALETGVPQSWVEIGLLVLLGYNVVAVSLSACGLM